MAGEHLGRAPGRTCQFLGVPRRPQGSVHVSPDLAAGTFEPRLDFLASHRQVAPDPLVPVRLQVRRLLVAAGTARPFLQPAFQTGGVHSARRTETVVPFLYYDGLFRAALAFIGIEPRLVACRDLPARLLP